MLYRSFLYDRQPEQLRRLQDPIQRALAIFISASLLAEMTGKLWLLKHPRSEAISCACDLGIPSYTVVPIREPISPSDDPT